MHRYYFSNLRLWHQLQCLSDLEWLGWHWKEQKFKKWRIISIRDPGGAKNICQYITGGCTNEKTKQCHFQWQQYQSMCPCATVSVNYCHRRPILEPQPRFCHGNSLPLSHRPRGHNLHGHPHTFPSGQSDFEQSCAKNWTRETNNVGVQMTLSLVCLVITNPQVILSLLVMKVSMVQICKWWWTSRDVGTQILGDFL